MSVERRILWRSRHALRAFILYRISIRTTTSNRILLFLHIRAHISTSQPTEYELTMSLFCVKWCFTHFVLAFITSAIRQCNAVSYLVLLDCCLIHRITHRSRELHPILCPFYIELLFMILLQQGLTVDYHLQRTNSLHYLIRFSMRLKDPLLIQIV